MPEIPGFTSCWGISVIHCPYCHGYEYRMKNTGIMLNGDKAFHISQLVGNLTDKITILSNGKADFSNDQISMLKKHHVTIINKKIDSLIHDNGHLKQVQFEDNSRMNFDVLYTSVPFTQHTTIPMELGCELSESGYIQIDQHYRTTIPGVYACGDNCSNMRSVAHAVFSGAMAGSSCNKELTEETF